MVKPKKRNTGKAPIDSPGRDDQHEDGDWIIVKKQRVTIMVSAAPIGEGDREPSHARPMHPVTSSSNRVELPIETSTLNPSGNEHEKAVLSAAEKETRVVRRASPLLPKSPLVDPPRVDQRIEPENPHPASILKSHELLGVSNASKAIKQPRTSLLAPRMSSNLVTLNHGLRASNLTRKLERAGGLSRWLASLGLEQFVRIFQGRSVGKFQLVNLTMQKLKDMGASAVGPRRKLIHAIDCVCQPYCFEAL